MRAIIKKTYKGEVAVSIDATFTDAPSLAQFLQSHGIYVEFKDLVSDVQMPTVVYTVPLGDYSGL